jgi:hypothetical protein
MDLAVKISRVVPASVRDGVKGFLRNRAVRQALAPLRRKGSMSEDEIAAFHRAWGNSGFAADKAFLAQLLAVLTEGPVLECGTGATTLLANEIGLQRGFRTYCLEQDPEWAAPVTSALRGSSAVNVIHAPLIEFRNYHWYDAPAKLPSHFALIICDGPYIDKSLGEEANSAWRYGVLAWLTETGRTFDTLLLDDVNDARAPPMLERWQREFGVSIERRISCDGELALVRGRLAELRAREVT